MTTQDEYTKQLEQCIHGFLKPLKGIPFAVVIKALTGFKVLPFDLTVSQNKKLVDQLSMAIKYAGENAYKEGIFADRPNEAGNHIEPFVIKGFEHVGLKAGTPVSKTGEKKAVGYPDIQVEDKFGRNIYIECKTYNTTQKNTTFRSFYLSPSSNPKITKDSFHLLVSFELTKANRNGEQAFIPISWQIYTLDKLLVQIKHEFNASNKDIYTKQALLAEGKLQ